MRSENIRVPVDDVAGVGQGSSFDTSQRATTALA